MSIGDIPESLRADPYQRLIAGHELVHALQDREHDLIARGLEIIGDLDSGYAFVAVMEGTAMVAGMAYMQGVPLDQLGDLGPMLRAGYEENNAGMEVFSRAPVYLQERLIGPYVDGATLVHAYLRSRPESTMATLFEELPASAEQALHFEKYEENDLPAAIDLSGVEELRPQVWKPLYANSLGEFEVRTLCKNQPSVSADAASIAAGWDGFRVSSWETGVGPGIGSCGGLRVGQWGGCTGVRRRVEDHSATAPRRGRTRGPPIWRSSGLRHGRPRCGAPASHARPAGCLGGTWE